MNIAILWSAWSGPIWAVGGAVGAVIRSRLQQERNRLDAGQQALELVSVSQKQQAMLAAAVERATANECAARAREVATADMIQDLHISLIGARLRCHDVEMRFGLEPTNFPLIPPFPWRPETNPHPPGTIGDHTRTECDTTHLGFSPNTEADQTGLAHS